MIIATIILIAIVLYFKIRVRDDIKELGNIIYNSDFYRDTYKFEVKSANPFDIWLANGLFYIEMHPQEVGLNLGEKIYIRNCIRKRVLKEAIKKT